MISRIFSSSARSSSVALDAVAMQFQEWLRRSPDVRVVAMSHDCVNNYGMVIGPDDPWFTASILLVYTIEAVQPA
jgi:hypothetical protein